MYAVIKTGGKQYRVSPGDILKIETLSADVGEAVDFEEVCMIADGDDVTVGTPTIAGAKVAASVVSHGRHKKIEIIKFKRRKHHQKRTGHRQNYTEIEIQNINGKGAPAKKADDAKAKKPAKKAAKAEDNKDKKPVEKKATAKKATAKKTAPKSAKSEGADDLSKIEGIGPKTAEALNAAGINSYADLAAKSVEELQTVLDEADGNFARFKPDTWPAQAKLAADGKWDELKKLQDELDGGHA